VRVEGLQGDAAFFYVRDSCNNSTQSFLYEVKNSHGQEKSDDSSK
jgi:hypothetical protein